MTDKRQIINAPELYINGLLLANNGSVGNAIDIYPGRCRDSSNRMDLEYPEMITVYGAAVGANGLDAGSLVANTWYALYAIGDSAKYRNPAFLLSSNFSTPFMPAGYDLTRLIGYILTGDGGTPDFVPFYMTGSGFYRKVYFDAPIPVLSTGAATSFAEVDISAGVPPVSGLNVSFEIIFTPDISGNIANFRPFGSSASAGRSFAAANGTTVISDSLELISLLDSGIPKIEYKVQTDDSLDLDVLSFEYFV